MPSEWTILLVSLSSILLLLAGIAFALDAIMTGRTPQGTIAWVVALIFLPPISIPLYLFFGSRRFVGYVRSRRRGRLEINALGIEAMEKIQPWAINPEQTRNLLLESFGALPPTFGNGFTLLIDGAATFEAIFQAIAQAQSYIFLQFFIIRDDDLGKQLESALLDARSRGVRIHVLFDEVGSTDLSRWSRSLCDAGIEVRAFRRSRAPRNRYRLNFRNHRKIVVVDGSIAFIGGLNIGNEYLGKDPRQSPWRDTHLRCHGPVVQSIQLAFCEDWYWASKRIPKAMWLPCPHPDNTPALVIASGPIDELETATLAFLSLITNAKQRIWISTPYFAPEESICYALQLAALRGIDVRILVPARTDNFLINFAHDTYFDDLLIAGVKVFSYAPGFVHQKVVLADNAATIGSANLDNRSLRINFEITLVAACDAFAQQVAEMLENDFAHSTQRTRAEISRRKWYINLRSRAARLLSPLL